MLFLCYTVNIDPITRRRYFSPQDILESPMKRRLVCSIILFTLPYPVLEAIQNAPPPKQATRYDVTAAWHHCCRSILYHQVQSTLKNKKKGSRGVVSFPNTFVHATPPRSTASLWYKPCTLARLRKISRAFGRHDASDSKARQARTTARPSINPFILVIPVRWIGLLVLCAVYWKRPAPSQAPNEREEGCVWKQGYFDSPSVMTTPNKLNCQNCINVIPWNYQDVVVRVRWENKLTDAKLSTLAPKHSSVALNTWHGAPTYPFIVKLQRGRACSAANTRVRMK